jgi:hypothetical protein
MAAIADRKARGDDGQDQADSDAIDALVGLLPPGTPRARERTAAALDQAGGDMHEAAQLLLAQSTRAPAADKGLGGGIDLGNVLDAEGDGPGRCTRSSKRARVGPK